MRRSIAILLPLLCVLASCGTTAQYSRQRFQDGIYGVAASSAETVHIYSMEEFEAMAAANIARKEREKDTVFVVLQDDDSSCSYNPWLYFGTAWALSYPYGWYDPFWYGWGWHGWHGWHSPWYSWNYPWYYYNSWYYDPWFHDPWFHDPWYMGPGWHGPGHHIGRPVQPGLSPDGNRYLGARRFTQSGGGPVRPGSSNYRSGRYPSGNYGASGASVINRRQASSGSSVTVRPSSSASSSSSSSRSGNYNMQRIYGGSSSSGSSTSVNSSATVRQNSNTGSYSTSRSYGGSGGGFSGGGSSSRSGGGGSSTRGGGGRR